jgi:hypothetical protein
MSLEDDDAETLFPGSVFDWLAAHQAAGVMFAREVKDMTRASARIFRLLSDRQWHSADEIRRVAGQGGIPASEGLRRMRDLRKVLRAYNLQIENARFQNSRMFYYRLQPC